jgi:predicted MFS family arabinose efflux permease
MTEAATAVDAFSPARSAAKPGRKIALGLLIVIGAINFMDRQILSVLIEPIKAALHLSDTEIGLLTGLSFALFYAALGVPVAMAADRFPRVRLVALACFIWSLFTGASGFVTSFWQLALARFGVGVGEAGGTAPSLSILADYYPPEQRPLVTGLFTANGPLGVFLGASLGGLAAEHFGWRGAFLAISLMGMVVAPLLAMCVREPKRGQMERASVTGERLAPTPLLTTAALFLKRPTLALLLAASGLAAFVSYGMLNWIPAFLMREEHMPLSAIAIWFGPAAGLCMGVGMIGGGALVNALGKWSERAYALVPGVAMLVNGLSFPIALFAHSWPASLALMLLPMITCTIYVPPALALVQNLAPVGARSTSIALLLLAFNIVGLGGGPLCIGMLSDALKRAHMSGGLGLALLALAPLSILAAVIYYGVSRTIVADAKLSRLEHGS